MKTFPSKEQTKMVHVKIINNTTVSKKIDDDDQPTEVISFTKIHKHIEDACSFADGPVEKIDCSLDFAFEKHRIKAIENTDLYISANTTNFESDKQNLATRHAVENLKAINEKYQKVDSATYWLRNLAIIFVLIYVAIVITYYIGMLILVMNNIPIKIYIVYLVLETLSSLLFLYICIRITGINRLTINTHQITIKICLIYIILDIIFIIFATHNRSIETLIIRIKNDTENDNEKNEKWLSYVILIIFLSNLIKIAVILTYLALWIYINIVIQKVNRIKMPDDKKGGCLNVK